MKTVVLDNSVILKAFFDEEGQEEVVKMLYLKNTFKLKILVPGIFPYEFFNIYARYQGKEKALRAFEDLQTGQFMVVDLDVKILKSALSLMERHDKVSFYDAAYHALAKVYNVDFVTADERYFEMMKGEGNVRLLSA